MRQVALLKCIPKRGNYSDMVTFNDEAMIRVLNMLDDILNKKYPFGNGVIDPKYYSRINEALNRVTDFILNSQIVVKGQPTAWCQQHDPFRYEPVGARSYEHPSICGKKSVGVVQFLMTRAKQTEEVQNAVNAAIKWFDESRVKGIRYVRFGTEDGEYFIPGQPLSLKSYLMNNLIKFFSCF